MDKQQKGALRQMVVASAALHHISTEQTTDTIDAKAFDAFLSDWFQAETAENLRSYMEGWFPIEIGKRQISKLVTIFSEIEIEDDKGKERVIRPTTIETYDDVEDFDDSSYRAEFQKHVLSMKERAKTLVWTSQNAFYQHFHALFKAYTGNIAAMLDSDRTSIGFYEQHKIDSVFDVDHREIHMVDFDLSGMQPFIYEVTEGGDAKRQVAKTVRGRSFYLSLLTDFVGYALLDAFDLPYENFVVSAGGKGTVAIVKSTESSERIKSMMNRIEETLFNHHRTKLSIAFTVRTGTKREIMEKGSHHAVDIDQKLSSSKKSKFKTVLEQFDQKDMPSVTRRCVLCGAPVEGDHLHCGVCSDAIHLSDVLAKDKPLTIVHDFRLDRVDRKALSIEIGDIGCIRIEQTETTIPMDHCYYVSLNHDGIGDIKSYANVFAKGKSFQEIAETNQGDAKIAVLKMDVDNLGLIFLTGLKIRERSYHKYLTLSRRIDYFFTNRLAGICRSDTYGNKVYVSYAGGDDLVIVCPAQQSLMLLNDIERAFKKYVCDHSNIHLSAGIEVFHPKSPFRHAVKFADRKLDQAKSVKGKNSFSVLTDTLPNRELVSVIDEIEYYKHAYLNDVLSKSIIRRLYLALNEAIQGLSPVVQFYSYVPHISYMLERNIDDKHVEERARLKRLFVTTDIDIDKLVKYHVVFGFVLMHTRYVKREEVHA